jgi:flagellar basal body-associated protein FliL
MEDNNDLDARENSIDLDEGIHDPDALSRPKGIEPEKKSNHFKFRLPVHTLIIIALVIALISGISITILAVQPAKKNQTTKTIIVNTQSLDNGTLNKIASQSCNRSRLSYSQQESDRQWQHQPWW